MSSDSDIPKNLLLEDHIKDGMAVDAATVARFNTFVTELPQTFPDVTLLELQGNMPKRVMLQAHDKAGALMELAILKASMQKAQQETGFDPAKVLVMAARAYPFSPEAVNELLELEADITNFTVNQTNN